MQENKEASPQRAESVKSAVGTDPSLDKVHITHYQRGRGHLYRAVPASRPRPLQCVDHAANPVFEEVGDVTEGIAMREKVPATGAEAVVVEPGAEDEIGGDAEEDTRGGIVSITLEKKNTVKEIQVRVESYMIIIHVKKPQEFELFCFPRW